MEYPKTLYVTTHDLLAEFEHTVSHIPLRKSDYVEIVQQIMVVMLDSFNTFRFTLARLPDFMPLYPNPALTFHAAREDIAIAVHRLGLAIYDRLQDMGAFVPQERCGDLGFFPYYLDRLVGGDVMLRYIDDEQAV